MLQESTNATSMRITRERGRSRMVGCMALPFVFMAFAGLAAWGIFRFSLPGNRLTRVGTTQEVQVFSQPVLFWEGKMPFYVMSVDGQVIALSAYSYKVGNYCLINWSSEKGMFIDPCWGTRMDISGKFKGGGPPWQMTRLPVTIQDEIVLVKVRFPDPEWHLGTAMPGK